jgi:hypothetical protein
LWKWSPLLYTHSLHLHNKLHSRIVVPNPRNRAHLKFEAQNCKLKSPCQSIRKCGSLAPIWSISISVSTCRDYAEWYFFLFSETDVLTYTGIMLSYRWWWSVCQKCLKGH